MVQKNAKRVKVRAGEMKNEDDRISRLPDDVIHHIYSFLDTRFAVQSSLLSRRWKKTWKSHPRLNFEINLSANQTRFSNFVHRFLSARDDNAEISTMGFRSNSISLVLLKEMITYAMSHRTRTLNIEFLGGKQTRRGGYDLSLLRSEFLQHLHMSIDCPVSICPPRTWDLPALTTLYLGRVSFTLHLPNKGATKSVDLFSSFPNLKSLVLVGCVLFDVETFVITSRRLENLSLINVEHFYNSKFVVSAPNLSSFTYRGIPRFSLLARDLHSLNTVTFHTVYRKSVTNHSGLAELMINTFHQLFEAKFLNLNLDALKYLMGFPELLERRPCPFMSLQSLTVVNRRLPRSLNVFCNVLNYFRSSSPALMVHIELDPSPSIIRFPRWWR